jgi:hypothetical protein
MRTWQSYVCFVGYANLETVSPSGSVGLDAEKNLAFFKRLM